jgi:hypothetical protein
MKHYLLLGAGFSRNWGGWLGSEVFEYLLGCPAVVADSDLQLRLWKHKDRGGFEAALEELQVEANRSGNRAQLGCLEGAIHKMFNDMDAGFRAPGGRPFKFEFSLDEPGVRHFLSRFDAIYTLNQDLLLERHYFNSDFPLINPQRWSGWAMHGMRQIPRAMDDYVVGQENIPTYTPTENYIPTPTQQPYFKLHGSSNWRDADGRLIIALGGNKAGTIQATNVLRRYFEKFSTDLSSGDARLMVIGYGFHDQHVDAVIQKAVDDRNLKIFIVDPLGVDVAQENRDTVVGKPPHRFRGRVIGASRRSLGEIFGSDQVERSKLLRFFS